MSAAVAEPNDYAPPSVSTQYGTLALLTVTYIFYLVDRQVLSILQEPIKHELGLSDSQLGLLTGVVFAVFYALAGVPVSRLADLYSRRAVCTWSAVVWGVATALSSLALNYSHLVLARIGVGVGQAGYSPAAYSLVAEVFPPQKRASAISILQSGAYLGVLVSLFAGGWLNEYLGWRMTLVAVAIPSLLLAVVLRVSIKEKVSAVLATSSLASPERETLLQVCLLLWSRKSIRCVALGSGTAAFASFGVLAWMPSYMVRVHGMSTGDLGTALGLISGVGIAVGSIATGLLADRLAAKDKRWFAWLPALAGLISAPAYLAVYLVEAPSVVLAILVLPMLLANVYGVLSITVTQGMVPPRMRATATAIVALIITLMGIGLGPSLVGLASDLLMPAHGSQSIRYALLWTIPAASLVSGLLFWWAALSLREDMQKVLA